MTDFLDCIRPADNQCMGCQAGWEFETTAAAVKVHRVRGGYPGELVVCTRHRYTDAEPDRIRPAKPGEPIDEDTDRAIPAAETCKLDTWCTRRVHPADEPCRVVPRRELERSDFGPKAAAKRRWG